MKTPILGGTYVARSLNAAASRMVNLFPEIIPEQGKEPAFLTRAPGLRKLATIGPGPIRGLYVLKNYLYVVSGNTLYKVDKNYNSVSVGNVSSVNSPVSIADNGNQLFIACNPEGYIYDTVGNSFSQITDTDFAGASTVGYLDGYFVFSQPNSQSIWVTELFDGSSIDALDFASAEGAPDNVVGLIVDHREVWIFGESSLEVFYNVGNGPNFPLQRIQGAFAEIGCVAPYSINKMDNGIFWLGKDSEGHGIVYRSQGYSGQRISTHAMEWQIQQYGDLSDAVGYAYQQEGHSFYVLIFPSANTTWVYDASTQLWHERAGFFNGEFVRHRSNCHQFFNSLNIVGDYQNGNIYAFDTQVYADNGKTQKWLRSWRALPTGKNDLRRTTQHSLQLDCETGVGLNTGQGEDPQVMLRWSDDGGHTWSNEHWVSIGEIGEFSKRAIWRRLGMTMKIRDRVYEISGTDPVKITILGAEILISPTAS